LPRLGFGAKPHGLAKKVQFKKAFCLFAPLGLPTLSVGKNEKKWRTPERSTFQILDRHNNAEGVETKVARAPRAEGAESETMGQKILLSLKTFLSRRSRGNNKGFHKMKRATRLFSRHSWNGGAAGKASLWWPPAEAPFQPEPEQKQIEKQIFFHWRNSVPTKSLVKKKRLGEFFFKTPMSWFSSPNEKFPFPLARNEAGEAKERWGFGGGKTCGWGCPKFCLKRI